MIEISTRRGFIVKLGALIMAPAIVRPESIMSVKIMINRTHRWLAAYYVGLDSILLRADVLNVDGVLCAPPMPSPRGVHPIPEYLQRQLDKRMDVALRALYNHANSERLNLKNQLLRAQYHVTVETPPDVLRELKITSWGSPTV